MFQNRFVVFLVTIILIVSSCHENKTGSDSYIRESMILDEDPDTKNIFVEKYLSRVQKVLHSNTPVLLLESDHPDILQAQEIALRNKKFTARVFEFDSHKALRNEIFNVYPARPQEIPQGYEGRKIYRVEMYNYALNFTTVALVDIEQKEVIHLSELSDTQPDIPAYLKDMAIQIAIHHPDVMTSLGYKPDEKEALMANTKTALNQSKCERSKHLCVAPTFTVKDKALWTIVDLTDLKVVGIRWTNTGKENEGPDRISEKRLKFDKIMECYCKTMNTLEKDDWKINYVITSSDGLRVSDVFYKNEPVFQDAKIVDWHVSYSNTDHFGYSDAVGCPEFSQAAVVAVRPPEISDLYIENKKAGFVLEQRFSSELWPAPCNYNYLQRFEFYTDGRFRIAGASLGRGCGNNGTYRPVFRIALGKKKSNFYYHTNNTWEHWTKEQWKMQDIHDHYTPEGFLYKIENDLNKGYYIEPNRGQFRDGSRGDNAYMFVTKHHKDIDEGDNDLVSIGPCCNTDYHQGPEKFIEPGPETITDCPLVLWYVPQIKNDNTPGKEYCWAERYLENGVYKTKVYPCIVGPMFIPF